jgi:hypothetical protein
MNINFITVEQSNKTAKITKLIFQYMSMEVDSIRQYLIDLP